MSKYLYLAKCFAFFIVFLLFSCGNDIENAEDAENALDEINDSIIGKIKKTNYQGENGYTNLTADLKKLQQTVSSIKTRKRGTINKEREKLEEVKRKISSLLYNIEQEKTLFAALNNEITKPIQKIESFIAFNKFAAESINRKKINDIQKNIEKDALLKVEAELKVMDELVSKPFSKDSKNFYCEAKKIFSKIDNESIYAFFGIHEVAYETQKVHNLIDSLKNIIKDYDFSVLRQYLTNIDYKLQKFEGWSNNTIKSGDIIEVDNNSSTEIPESGKKKGFYFKLEGITFDGKVKGRMSKPEHSEQSVLLSVNAQEEFVVNDKTFLARFVDIKRIEDGYEVLGFSDNNSVENPKNTLKRGKVIIEIMEYNREIGCDNLK